MQIEIINTQRVLSPTQINISDYVINPYRGCEFGCVYCYSQENKNTQNNNFSTKLGVKINAPSILKKELKYKKPKKVLLGSTTECFQYQELKYKITEEILLILNFYNIPYTILTKSHLVTYYLPIIAKNHENKIYFTFNCSRDDTIRTLEKKSPFLKERIEAIKEIINNKINLRIHIGPFIPYVSLLTEIFSLLPSGIKEVDIELYHKNQGNFQNAIYVIEKKFGKKVCGDLMNVYASEKDYLEFTSKLKEEIKNLCKDKELSLFYIIPDFKQFYSRDIDYETSRII